MLRVPIRIRSRCFDFPDTVQPGRRILPQVPAAAVLCLPSEPSLLPVAAAAAATAAGGGPTNLLQRRGSNVSLTLGIASAPPQQQQQPYPNDGAGSVVFVHVLGQCASVGTLCDIASAAVISRDGITRDEALRSGFSGGLVRRGLLERRNANARLTLSIGAPEPESDGGSSQNASFFSVQGGVSSGASGGSEHSSEATSQVSESGQILSVTIPTNRMGPTDLNWD